MFVEAVPGVYAFHSRFVDGKAGVILGERGALAIDACNYPDEGRALAEFIRKQGWGPCRLALTHGHGDHILGGEAFVGAEVFAHDFTPGVIRRQLSALAKRMGKPHTEAEASVIWPTITFTEAMCIDLGGRHVRLFHTPGHSEDGICAYVEEEDVLFGGDTVVTGIVPAIADGDSVTLEATLRRLRDLPIKVLIPGHGPILRGEERVREWIGGWAEYLSRARARVRAALDRGDDPERIAEELSFREFVGERLPMDRYNMPRRHRNTVAKIVEEEMSRRRAT